MIWWSLVGKHGEFEHDNHDLSVLTSKNGGIMGIHDEIRGI
jgi:hypothetical protein